LLASGAASRAPSISFFPSLSSTGAAPAVLAWTLSSAEGASEVAIAVAAASALVSSGTGASASFSTTGAGDFCSVGAAAASTAAFTSPAFFSSITGAASAVYSDFDSSAGRGLACSSATIAEAFISSGTASDCVSTFTDGAAAASEFSCSFAGISTCADFFDSGMAVAGAATGSLSRIATLVVSPSKFKTLGIRSTSRLFIGGAEGVFLYGLIGEGVLRISQRTPTPSLISALFGSTPLSNFSFRRFTHLRHSSTCCFRTIATSGSDKNSSSSSFRFMASWRISLCNFFTCDDAPAPIAWL